MEAEETTITLRVGIMLINCYKKKSDLILKHAQELEGEEDCYRCENNMSNFIET